VTILHDWAAWIPQLLEGLRTSVIVTLLSLLIGLPLGLLLAFGAMSHRPLVRYPVIAFVELGRGVPLLVLL